MNNYQINIIKCNLEKYNSTPLIYQKYQIILLMGNKNTHLFSIFKDYLLFDDSTEFLKEYYDKKKIYRKLKTIYDYYKSSSYLFPNYNAIIEGKYIYRNIIKKQKLINYLEDLEDKKNEKEGKEKLNKKNIKLRTKSQNEESRVFNTKVYDIIRKETENDSKINELFCVEKKNNDDCESYSSILKFAEMLKEKEIKVKTNNTKENIKKRSDSNNINKNNKKAINNYNYDNMNKTDKKKVISRINTNQNSKIYNKKIINKGTKKFNLNNFRIKKNGLISNEIYLNEINKKKKQLNIELNKKDDMIIRIQKAFKSNKNIKKCYKKNDIFINIINNNKNNNRNITYNSENSFFQNYANTIPKENNIVKNIYINNYIKTENDNIKDDPRINLDKNNIKNKNIITKRRSLQTINFLSKNKYISINNKCNRSRNNKMGIKSKLLSNYIRILTEKIKVKSNSSQIQKSKNKTETKAIFTTDNIKNHNMKKRTKTEILGNKKDLFIFGQQSEINPYNKSRNRKIFKNINSSNNSKPRKNISFLYKMNINYQFNKTKNMHNSINIQNSTDTKIINKISPFSTIDTVKKEKVGVIFVNKTEKISRNHSKGKINNINNTTFKNYYRDSFSPLKTQDLIYNKFNTIRNKNKNIYYFMKIQNLKNKSNYNYISNINNILHFQRIKNKKNNNNKEMHNKIYNGKLF